VTSASGTRPGPSGARQRALRELPLEERPRERLQRRGPSGLATAEVVALVWGSGCSGRNALDIAAGAVAAHGGVAGLARASAEELERLPGVGSARAAQLAAAFELGRRAAVEWPAGRLVVRTPRDLADRLVPEMGRLEREELRVALLNTKNVVLAVETVYRGNVSTALVRVGELFRDAVRRHAAGLIVVHNHPSGDPSPSPDDLHLTAEAVAAGRLLDVAVLDHLIVGHDAYVSLRDRGVPFEQPGGSLRRG
jgi:DNA repair protein RadC